MAWLSSFKDQLQFTAESKTTSGRIHYELIGISGERVNIINKIF